MMGVLNFESVAVHLRQHGPTRVVVDEQGYATTPERAARDYDVTPTVVYVREDGWTLGAPDRLEHVARNLWADGWVAVARWPSWDVRPWG